MFLVAVNTLLKYFLHTIDLQSENPWENKPIYLRYVDIVVGEEREHYVVHCTSSQVPCTLHCRVLQADSVHELHGVHAVGSLHPPAHCQEDLHYRKVSAARLTPNAVLV